MKNETRTKIILVSGVGIKYVGQFYWQFLRVNGILKTKKGWEKLIKLKNAKNKTKQQQKCGEFSFHVLICV